MVAVWAGRLGTYLVKRIMRDKEDVRFAEAKKSPGTFFVYWSMQVTSHEEHTRRLQAGLETGAPICTRSPTAPGPSAPASRAVSREPHLEPPGERVRAARGLPRSP